MRRSVLANESMKAFAASLRVRSMIGRIFVVPILCVCRVWPSN